MAATTAMTKERRLSLKPMISTIPSLVFCRIYFVSFSVDLKFVICKNFLLIEKKFIQREKPQVQLFSVQSQSKALLAIAGKDLSHI